MILEGEQMGLFRKKGRSDIDAWAKAMIQGYKKGMPIDKALLEQATDQSIRNDCRIIGRHKFVSMNWIIWKAF